MRVNLFSPVAAFVLFAHPAPAHDQAPSARRLKEESLVLRADEVHVGDGTVYRPGTVVVLDGKVVAVGGDPGLPASTRTIELPGCAITPGLVDAACQLGASDLQGYSEQSSEVIPHLSVRDAVDLRSRVLRTLAREGVTTIFLTPEPASVIGSQGAVLKTGGEGHSRFVEAPPTIQANMGAEGWRRASFNRTPSRFGDLTFLTRRPTTRMGSYWVFRKALYDAVRCRETGATEHATEACPEALAVLGEVLEGRVGLRIQARAAHDIHGAQRVCDEFGLTHVLEYATEAHRCLDLLAAKRTPVIYGPILREPVGVTTFDVGFGSDMNLCLTTPVKLAEAGVPFCLTACDLSGELGLARQAGMAIRHGLDPAEALACATARPADLLGVGDRLGRLASGMEADVVVWNGPPLEDLSKPVLVLIDGRVVHDEGRRVPEEIEPIAISGTDF